MHSLIGTYVLELPELKIDDLQISVWPLKVIIPPTKSRMLYFHTLAEQKRWSHLLQDQIGFRSVEDYYTLKATLGHG